MLKTFYTIKKYRDELFDWAETYDKIKNFHKQNSTQKKIWENAQDKIRLIEKVGVKLLAKKLIN